jgi:2-amino-4-hydroxy-6-hydroxymethyldihydropteridine diphosphokinase
MTHVVLSLGSNINRDYNIRFALDEIIKQFGKIDVSPIYETTSVGFKGDSFLNLVVGLETDKELLDVRTTLRNIEAEAGRIRGRKAFDNRLLDIDVILFGDGDFSSEYNIPRDEILKYAYVLKPLSDMYPKSKHPVLGLTYESMWAGFDLSDQELQVVKLNEG